MMAQVSFEALLWMLAGAFFIALVGEFALQMLHLQNTAFPATLANLSHSINASIFPYSEFHIRIV